MFAQNGGGEGILPSEQKYSTNKSWEEHNATHISSPTPGVDSLQSVRSPLRMTPNRFNLSELSRHVGRRDSELPTKDRQAVYPFDA